MYNVYITLLASLSLCHSLATGRTHSSLVINLNWWAHMSWHHILLKSNLKQPLPIDRNQSLSKSCLSTHHNLYFNLSELKSVQAGAHPALTHWAKAEPENSEHHPLSPHFGQLCLIFWILTSFPLGVGSLFWSLLTADPLGSYSRWVHTSLQFLLGTNPTASWGTALPLPTVTFSTGFYGFFSLSCTKIPAAFMGTFKPLCWGMTDRQKAAHI
jgi:hypothetical protein